MTERKRKYTVTIKPTKREFLGDKEKLNEAFDTFLKLIGGKNNHVAYEKEGSFGMHLHALISTPLIKDKKAIAKQLSGYHLHTEIIPFKHYDSITDVWKRYTLKEKSDADRYTLLYGPSIPLHFPNDQIINYDY